MAFLTRNGGAVLAQDADLQRLYAYMVMYSAALVIPVEESRPTSVLAIDRAEKSRDMPATVPRQQRNARSGQCASID
jgi:hypothetical protein